MSTPSGDRAVIDQAMRDGRALLTAAAAEEEQLGMFEPLSSEELVEAREALGPGAGPLTVVRHAREARRGRPKGARNKRTDDLVAYLSQFGPDPLVAAMRILAEDEEMMIQRSRDNGDGKRTMTFGEARAMRQRSMELLAPYWHSKKPVAVDHSFSGVGDMYIDGVNHSTRVAENVTDAEFLPLDDGSAEGGA